MKLIDMHCDTISELFHSTKEQSLMENELCVDLEGMKQAGTWIQYFACFVNARKYEEQSPENLVQSWEQQFLLSQGRQQISPRAWDRAWEEALKLTERMRREESAELRVVQNCQEAEKNWEKGSISALLTVEEGGVLNGSLKRLEELYRRGVRLITLTWNYENCIGYPNSRDTAVMQKGLKPFGVEVIRRMNELGMLIDVSHLSDGGFWDCIRESTMPVAASHSNARALCNHPRNLTDGMLRALAEKGGVAGLNFYPAFLRENERVTTADIARHAKHMIQIAGEDVAAIGTDFDGFETDLKEGYISHVSEMELVWDACKKAGITERQLDKICWENAWRVMKEALP